MPAPQPGDQVTVELGAGAAKRGSQVQSEMGLGREVGLGPAQSSGMLTPLCTPAPDTTPVKQGLSGRALLAPCASKTPGYQEQRGTAGFPISSVVPLFRYAPSPAPLQLSPQVQSCSCSQVAKCLQRVCQGTSCPPLRAHCAVTGNKCLWVGWQSHNL